MIKTVENLKIKEIPGINLVEKELYELLQGSHENTYNICKRLITSGGKRIRPALVLSTAGCFGKVTKEAIQASAACECIHMASLVHDDIIDESTMRRGTSTVNDEKGNHTAVLVGDYLFAKAFEILSKNKLVKSMEVIVDAISKMCDGEIFQSENLFNLDQTREDYYHRIYQKTGVLIATCTQVGAITAGADEEQIRAFRIYGENLGYAYQIIDDILDFKGDEKILGKPVGSDLKEGNITLPILKLIQDKEYKDWIKKIIKKGDIEENYNQILRLLKESYALEEAFGEAKNCVENAKQSLDCIEDSIYKDMLLNIANQVLTRKN
ncbi:polyprenyl synthetase family protein [Crassaminicella profunda]|uniref:polyprenyl synthetase family protein n=1 Tax=Crassaminicella profunda TaxID=1286698 RepID=UPI001CA61F43|nr:polyprenyl synthetase family protein [Crassaminicella profunda]QZY55039.1 polyprenyl synthetase family protein [Crassaminicella profunda]